MKTKRVIMGLALMVFSLTLVSAFGVSTFYWDGNPVKLAPGESATVNLVLQNMIGDEDYTFEAEMSGDGDGIARLVNEDNEYFVPAKTQRQNVPIEITIPADTKYGEVRWIQVSFVPKVTNEGGMVQLINAVGSRFPVEIVAEEKGTFYEKPLPVVEEESKGITFYIVIVVLLLVIIYLVTNKRKK